MGVVIFYKSAKQKDVARNLDGSITQILTNIFLVLSWQLLENSSKLFKVNYSYYFPETKTYSL